MAQVTSSGWANKVAQGKRDLNYGVLISWLRTTASGVRFFTINQSRIGGMDIIKGGGTAVTFFDKYQFGDYSQFVSSWSVARKMGQFPYGTIMAQADVELNNASKVFLPNFDPTIGSGILPNRPMKISLGLEGESLQQFVGFTGMPENTLGNRLTRLHAYDAFNFINGYVSAASGAFVNKYAHEIKASLLGEMGFGSGQYVLDKSLQQPIGYISTNGRKVGDVWQDLDEAEQALSFVDETGIITSWNRQHFTTLSGTQAFAFNYSKLSDLQWQNTPIINDVIVLANPRSVKNGQPLWTTQTAIELIAGTTTDVFVSFTDEDGELPVTSVVTPAHLAASTSTYALNFQRDGSDVSNPASYISIVSDYTFGNRYRITFRNTYTSSIFITAMTVWGTPATVDTHISKRYFDQTSIDNFGRNPANNGVPLEITNDFIQDPSSAYSLAYTLVKEYKDPRKRYLAPVAVGSNPALQIGDYGSITIADTAEVKNVYITGKVDKLKRNGFYEQIVELEERNIRKYFTINQSKIGGTDSIAP